MVLEGAHAHDLGADVVEPHDEAVRVSYAAEGEDLPARKLLRLVECPVGGDERRRPVHGLGDLRLRVGLANTLENLGELVAAHEVRPRDDYRRCAPQSACRLAQEPRGSR